MPEANTPLVDSILFPTDFSEMGQAAFSHALALALLRETKLTLLHVMSGKPSDETWTAFPAVRGTLESWGLLEHDSPRSAVLEQLKLRVSKIAVDASDPLHGILGYLARHPTDLMVLATRGLDGLPRFVQGSTSEPVARRSRTMTLFVPATARGFTSGTDGSISLQRILVPVDLRPHPFDAIELAMRAARLREGQPTRISVLHVGAGAQAPQFPLPEAPGLEWEGLQRDGDPVEQIVAAATETQADLIVMVTEGHRGILDALRGSTTERVLRHAPCPVLAVPLGWVQETLARKEPPPADV